VGVKHPVLAWGLGVSRVAMLRLGLKDLRQLYRTDIDLVRETPSWHPGQMIAGGDEMAVITLYYRYLERLVGSDRETILARLPMLGSDIERVEEDHVDVEFFPCRPDLFSAEGVARAMKGFLGLETGLPEYRVTPSGISFTVDPGLASIRPYLGTAVIRGISLDEEAILSLMGLQEALHWALGRGRAKWRSGSMTWTVSPLPSGTLPRNGPGLLYPLTLTGK